MHMSVRSGFGRTVRAYGWINYRPSTAWQALGLLGGARQAMQTNQPAAREAAVSRMLADWPCRAAEAQWLQARKTCVKCKVDCVKLLLF